MWLLQSSMRSAFAPESECLTKESELRSAILALSCEQWPMASGKPLQPASLLRSWKQDAWSQRLCGAAIFDASTQDVFVERWTSSLRASRARTSASPAAAPGSMESEAACSSMLSPSQTIAVRASSFWRTSQESFLPPPPLWTKPRESLKSARLPASWENWPTAGGMRNGSMFQRPMWEPATGGNDGFALPGGGWMTPSVSSPSKEYTRDNGVNGQERLALGGQASQWATPRTITGGAESAQRKKELGREESGGGDLQAQVNHWPTPQAHDAVGGKTPQQVQAMRERSGAGVSNLNEVAPMWPTPTSSQQNINSASTDERDRENGKALADAAGSWSHWPTPASRDYRSPNSESLKDRGGGMKGEQLPNFVEHHFSPQAPAIQVGPESSPPTPGSRRRLNPAFGSWLMGWPCWWTNPGITSCAKSEMELYRFALRWQLSSLLREPGSSP